MKYTVDYEADRISGILSSTFYHVLERKDDSFLHINNYLLEDDRYDDDDYDGGDFHLTDEIVKEVNMLLFDSGLFFIPFTNTSIVIKIEKLLLNNPTLKALIWRNDAAQKKDQEKDQE